MVGKRPKSNSWLQRNIPKSERKKVGAELWHHRTQHINVSGYTKSRSFASLKRDGFDIEAYLRRRMPKKGMFSALDSGSGYCNLSADIKRTFGDRVFVTALNLRRPEIPKKVIDQYQQRIKEAEASLLEKGPDKLSSYLKNRLVQHLNNLKKLVEDAKLIDEHRVAPIENFSPKRQYNVIIDLWGPVEYSHFRRRVLEKYFTLLKPNGVLLIGATHTATWNTSVVEGPFNQKGAIARKTGYYFKKRRLLDDIIELKKVSVKVE